MNTNTMDRLHRYKISIKIKDLAVKLQQSLFRNNFYRKRMLNALFQVPLQRNFDNFRLCQILFLVILIAKHIFEMDKSWYGCNIKK